MSHDEQLAWEARAGKPAAIVAFAAAVLGFAGYVLSQTIIASSDDGADGFLKEVDERSSDFIAAGALQAASFLLLIAPLLYLFRASRHRRPELSPTAAVLLVLGALTLAVMTVVQQFKLLDIARDFFPFEIPDDAGELRGDAYAEAVDPEEAAEERISDELGAVVPGFIAGGTLALAFAVVMISVNSMRVGLLSRFMGVLGIGVGVMLVIPFGVQPILQLFWLGAVAAILLDRWPGGRGPAWQTGEAIPWPGAAEQREEIERRRAEREPEPEPEPEP
ncbi:MAG: DUF4386 family protein, partial [Actinomycetota bacterium]|nr:DUF4386 family protein [Actinomycetota bacterium]